MSKPVYIPPRQIPVSEIVPGGLVSSSVMLGLTDNVNYLLGIGTQLVSANTDLSYSQGGEPGVYRYRVYPTDITVARLWIIRLAAGYNWSFVTDPPGEGDPLRTSQGLALITIDAGLTDEASGMIAISANMSNTCYIVQPYTAQSWTVREATVSIFASNGDADRITTESISCVEIPRYAAEYGTANGADNVLAGRNQPIYQATTGAMLGGISHINHVITSHIMDYAKRASLFHFYSLDGLEITNTSYVNRFIPEALARYVYSGITAVAVPIAIYGRVSNAGRTGSVRFTSSTGATTTLTITSTTNVWVAGTLVIHTEYPAAATGRRSSPEQITIEVMTNGDTFYLHGVAISEDYTPPES